MVESSELLKNKTQDENEILSIFKLIKNERNEVANIHSSFSSFPEGVKAHYEFYKKLMLDDNLPLPRGEREYLAVLTSEFNTCEYCVEHHKAALSENLIKLNPSKAKFYRELTKVLCKEPWKSCILKKRAKNLGISERQYSHIIMIISYFNMANRLIYGNDIELEENHKSMCQ